MGSMADNQRFLRLERALELQTTRIQGLAEALQALGNEIAELRASTVPRPRGRPPKAKEHTEVNGSNPG